MSTDGLPDWDKVAEKFDLWLPQLQPVNDALIGALHIEANDKILDIACGTGEPALTIASQNKNVQVVATDAAAGMIGVVNKKIEKLGLQNIRTQLTAVEDMDFDAGAFDKLVCRFGVMLFDDPLLGLTKMAHALKSGGGFVFAVWSTPETMPNINWSYLALKDRLPKELHPPIAKATSLSEVTVFEDILHQAGFQSVRITRKSFDYHFKDTDEYWQTLLDSELLSNQLAQLSKAEQEEVGKEIAMYASEFQTENGLVIPHEYLLAEGNK